MLTNKDIFSLKNISPQIGHLMVSRLSKHPMRGDSFIMEEKKVKIYALIDPVTKRARYIGKTEQTLERRLKQHYYCRKGAVKKREWLEGHLKKGRMVLIQLIDIIPLSDWVESEIYWIKYYTELHGNMLNIMSGGQTGYGIKPRKPHTQEFKDKMSKLHKGNKYCLGIKQTDEAKKKRGESIRRCYEEGRRKPTSSFNHKKTIVMQYDKFNVFINEFPSVKMASQITGVGRTNITENIRGKNGSAGGYIFKYKL